MTGLRAGPSREFLFLCRALGPEGPGEDPPASPFRWDRFLRLAREKGVSALLSRRPRGNWPEPVAQALREDYHRTLAENLLRLSAVAGVLEALTRRGVPVILLKGIDLLDRIHRDPGARSMIDTDLLVRPGSCPEADAVLAGCGYRLLAGQRPSAPPRVTDRINSAMYRHPQSGLQVHLHWHIVNETFPRAGRAETWDMARLWGDAVPAPGNAPARALAPPHLLVHLAAHGLKHGFGLLHVHEFSLAAATLVPHAARPEAVVEAARDFGQLPALRWMLRVARERFGPGTAAALSERVAPFAAPAPLERLVLAGLRRGRESALLGILARESGSGALPLLLQSLRISLGAPRGFRHLAYHARALAARA